MAEDPVQDFLKREEDAMAGLEDPTAEIPSVVSDDLDSSGMGGIAQNGLPPENAADFLPDSQNNYGQEPVGVPEPEEPKQPPAQVYQKPKIEPEKLRIWREEFQQRIEKKDAEEDVAMEKMRKQAKKELDDWYKKYEEQLENNNKHNKIAEEEFIRDRDAPKPGKEWEKITSLCEFNPKAAKNTKDVTRLRGMLLQLKAGGNEK